LRQVADQMLSGDAGHGAVSMMDAALAVVSEGMGKSVGIMVRATRRDGTE